jgi:hypothetical protein
MSMLIPDAAHDDLHLGERPLIVCDIDEVVLEFVSPFMAYLDHNGHELRATSFPLARKCLQPNRRQRDTGRDGERDAGGFLRSPGQLANAGQ